MKRTSFKTLYSAVSKKMGISIEQSKNLVKTFSLIVLDTCIDKGSCAISGLGSIHMTNRRYKARLRGESQEGTYNAMSLILSKSVKNRLKSLQDPQ